MCARSERTDVELAALLATGDPAAALGSFQRVVELQPRRAAAWSNLAVAAAKSGSIEEAIAAARRAVELEPASALYRENPMALESSAGGAPR